MFEELDDPYAVAEALRADISLDEDQRYTALRVVRVVRELASEWWTARESAAAESKR